MNDQDRIEELLLDRGRLQCRCAVHMTTLATLARKHPELADWIAKRVKLADTESQRVERSHLTTVTVSGHRRDRRGL